MNTNILNCLFWDKRVLFLEKRVIVHEKSKSLNPVKIQTLNPGGKGREGENGKYEHLRQFRNNG